MFTRHTSLFSPDPSLAKSLGDHDAVSIYNNHIVGMVNDLDQYAPPSEPEAPVFARNTPPQFQPNPQPIQINGN